MKKNVWKKHDNLAERLNGINVSLTDIQTIYNSLLTQYEDIAQEIVDSVDRNDYVKLSRLIIRRKKIRIAIDEIESLYEKELHSTRSIKDHIATVLRNSAQLTETKGEEVLLAVRDTLENLNQSTHSITIKTLDSTTKIISISNQLNHRAGSFLIKHTSYGLAKLADAFKKES